MKTLALFGGSFDPIHRGHIETAKALQALFHFQDFQFLPCKKPVLKSPTQALAPERIEMLRLALQDYPQFKLNLSEIERETPSYTIDTLETLKKAHPDTALFFIMGMDAFAEFNLWKDWEKIPGLCNLIIMDRNTASQKNLTPILQELFNKNVAADIPSFMHSQHGKIYRINAGDYPLESRKIRKAIQTGLFPEEALDPKVGAYIKSLGLYQ